MTSEAEVGTIEPSDEASPEEKSPVLPPDFPIDKVALFAADFVKQLGHRAVLVVLGGDDAYHYAATPDVRINEAVGALTRAAQIIGANRS